MANRCIRKMAVFVGFVVALFFIATPVSAVVQSDRIERSADFEVNIDEVLLVSLTVPDNWATGNVGEFLRNTVTLTVASNNSNGVTASMTTKSAVANLVNNVSSNYIVPTLVSSSTRSDFPTNYWGYSINDTSGGSDGSTYSKIAALGESPNQIVYSASAANISKDIYFGAKAGASQPAGTYSATVIFSVVSGVVDPNTNPMPPDDPVVPGGGNNPSYDQDEDITVYTSSTSSNGRTQTTTEISKGDNRSSYAAPQGVTSTVATNISEGTPLATGLAATAAVAATTGVIFFIVAKRKKDDEDDEEID